MPKATSARTYLNSQNTPLKLPNLIKIQQDSYKWFLDEGLKELFEEVSPIEDFTAKKYELSLKDYRFEAPKLTEEQKKRLREAGDLV